MQIQMNALPGEHARVNAARWLFRGYVFFAAMGIVLHMVFRQFAGEPIDWVYQILTAGVGMAALYALWKLEKSLSHAMLAFAWITMFCIGGLLVYQILENGEFFSILFMFHIGIFSVGLILGFRPALCYAAAANLIILGIGILYQLDLSSIILPVVLAFAVVLPSKVVEHLIAESTAELSRINEKLREENIERRRAETELQRHQDHLEELVEERTLELREEIAERQRAEEALRQRTLQLEARNEELDAFAHTVAHDLKSPLTSLVGYSSLLGSRHNKLPEDKMLEALNIIAQSGRKMTNIIDALLLLATVRKAGDVEMDVVDMGVVVGDVQMRLEDMIQNQQATIITPEIWPPVIGYAPWIEEVWANYISNAIKYGGRPPLIQLGATEQSDDCICFWVRDNGKGLTPEEQARLFTPFTRLDQIRAKGHGLGLSIVRRIVERLNGQVCVESEIGRGSVFKFTLPQTTPFTDSFLETRA